MKSINFRVALILLLSTISSNAFADIFLYRDNVRRLYFTINTALKEAAVGTGDNGVNTNAYVYPDIGSPEWNGNYHQVWNNIVIPEKITVSGVDYTVTGITASAFYKGTEIKSITLPKTINYIGDYAFAFCTNMANFQFPEELTTITPFSFAMCWKLDKINLPAKIKSIGAGAFHDCIGATEVTIPAACTSVADEAFTYCTNVTKVTIEDGPLPLKMGSCIEKGYTQEEAYTPDRRGMFGNCKKLRSFHWGRNMTFDRYQGYDFLYNYGPLQTTFNKTLWLTDLTFGKDVTSIPAGVFMYGYCESLVLPPNLERIEDEAFLYMTYKNGSLVFPESLKYVGNRAFDASSSVGGIYAKMITAKCKVPPEIKGNPFYADKVVIEVPEGCGEAYRKHSFWGKRAIYDPADPVVKVNVKTAGSLYSRLLAQGIQIQDVSKLTVSGTMDSNDWSTLSLMPQLIDLDISAIAVDELTEGMVPKTICKLKLPNTLKCIGENALKGTPITGTLVIPPSCTEIKEHACNGTLIDNLVLPENNLRIGSFAFASCCFQSLNLKHVTLTECAFYDNTSLTSVTLGDFFTVDNKFDSSSPFASCNNISTITFEGNVQFMGWNMFSHCIDESEGKCSIKEIIFNGKVNSKYASSLNTFGKGRSPLYDEAPKFWKLTIKDMEGYMTSVFGIKPGDSPAVYAKEVNWNGAPVDSLVIPEYRTLNLTDKSYQEPITRIYGSMYRNFKDLKYIKLPSRLRSIEPNAFQECKLESIVIPDTVDYIDDLAFFRNHHLKTVVLSRRLDWIGEIVFTECDSLESVISLNVECPTVEDKVYLPPFKNVPESCCLTVPIGSAIKYREGGFVFSKMKEVIVADIIVQGHGSVKNGSTSLTNGSHVLTFTPFQPFELSLEPPANGKLVSVTINGENVSAKDNKLYFDDPDQNYKIVVTFYGDVGIDDVLPDNDDATTPANIYSVDGRIVKKNGTLSDINNLPPGLYIMNGKRYIVR